MEVGAEGFGDQGLADAERDVPLALQLGEGGVNDPSGVRLDVQVDDAHGAGLQVDLDFGGRSGVVEVRRHDALARFGVEPAVAGVHLGDGEAAEFRPAEQFGVAQAGAEVAADPVGAYVTALAGTPSSVPGEFAARSLAPARSTATPIIRVERDELVVWSQAVTAESG